MKATVCELPYEDNALQAAWAGLCAHVSQSASDLVLLPEFAFSPPVWLTERFEPLVWADAEARHARWESRLSELGATWVIGTRPVSEAGAHYNEAFLWSAGTGAVRLRRKYFLPDEAEGWEARWFNRGDETFSRYEAGGLAFGVNICTELWALESLDEYRSLRIGAVVSPRATAAVTTEKWLALGTVVAVVSGAYCLSSNRVHTDGSCGGVGWVIDPDGKLLARTSPAEPAHTVRLDLSHVEAAAQTYPRYIFRAPGSRGGA
jgi:N-carbamoylputrescine amidase